MEGKTCIVTGATDGIGLVTARVLAERGARVVLVGRSESKGKRALEQIRALCPGASLQLVLADLSVRSEVNRLADELLDACARIDVLVNNAGAFFQRRALTVDGIERTFALNHLAYFLLTARLLERLRQSQTARIVNVSSRAHQGGQIRFHDINWEQEYRGWSAYRMSKLANILFTAELAERLAGSGVTANCLHPGFVATNFALDNPWPLRTLVRLVMRLQAISSEAGAETSVYLASSAAVESVTGKYFASCREQTPSRAAQDRDAQARLWALSEELTGCRT